METELKEPLEGITRRLALLESTQQTDVPSQKVQQPIPDNVNTDVSTQPNEFTLLGSASACVKDHLKEFDQICERLAKVSLPTELKVNDNSTGIKLSPNQPASRKPI